MRLFAALFAVVLLLPSAGRAEEASNVDLLKAFAGVALGSEYEKRKPRILKWDKPVNVALVGTGYPPLVENLVLEQVATLGKETGLRMALAYSDVMRREKRLPPDVSKIPINLLVVYAPKKDLPALVEKQTGGAFKAPGVAKMAQVGFCHSRIQIEKSGALKFAYIAIPAEIVTQVDYGSVRVDPALFTRACVVEEMAQVMGLPNDVPGLKFSIFSDDSAHVDLTAEDRWMLRMLYDPRLKPGMAPDQALPLVVSFLKEKRPGK